MSLEKQAQEYWGVCQRYRGSYSQIAKTRAAQIEVPSLYNKATNTRIQMHLHNIMLEEGIDIGDDEAAV